jgi:hypothetical protein
MFSLYMSKAIFRAFVNLYLFIICLLDYEFLKKKTFKMPRYSLESKAQY